MLAWIHDGSNVFASARGVLSRPGATVFRLVHHDREGEYREDSLTRPSFSMYIMLCSLHFSKWGASGGVKALLAHIVERTAHIFATQE